MGYFGYSNLLLSVGFCSFSWEALVFSFPWYEYVLNFLVAISTIAPLVMMAWIYRVFFPIYVFFSIGYVFVFMQPMLFSLCLGEVTNSCFPAGYFSSIRVIIYYLQIVLFILIVSVVKLRGMVFHEVCNRPRSGL